MTKEVWSYSPLMKPLSRKNNILTEVKNHYQLFILLLPMLLYFIIFHYLPMIGHTLAFVEYRYDTGIFGSPFIGLKNFEYLFTSGKLASITWNTLRFNTIFLVLNRVVQVTLAIIICELSSKIFRKISVSLIFLLFFISYVIIGTIAYNLFNFEHGLLNTIITSIGLNKVDIYANKEIWIIILPLFNLWK